MDCLDECPIIDPLSFPLRIALHKDFYLLLQTNRVLQNIVVHLILPFLYFEHLSKIPLGLGNRLKETSGQVQQLLVCCHDQCAPLEFTFLTYEMRH